MTLIGFLRRHSAVLLILILAICVRLYSFSDSVYFAFDQARDAYTAADIYTKHDLKFIGPPVTGNVGLFHGVLFWYLIGPLYLLFHFDPVPVAFIFRVLNALGVLFVYGIGQKLFNRSVALSAAFIFAVSYEQSQYALYVGNPSLGVLAVLIMMYGFSSLISAKPSRFSLALILGGAGLGAQFNFMFWYLFFLAFFLLFLFRKYTRKLTAQNIIFGIFAGFLSVSSYLIAELQHGFRSVFRVFNLVSSGYSIMAKEDSKLFIFLDKYLVMFMDNFTGRQINRWFIISLLTIVVIWLIRQIKNPSIQLILAWQFGWLFLMLFGGHTAYYTTAGLSIGLVFGVILFLFRFTQGPAFIACLLLVSFFNLSHIAMQNKNSVSYEFITQDLMRLTDEISLIDKIYEISDGHGFTVRQTGIPYHVQTTWSFLFHKYGLAKHGYLPYWETGMVAGFPGSIPTPSIGTTCQRFRLVEPSRGLPPDLIEKDLHLEDELSQTIHTFKFGSFVLEERRALDPNCHEKPPFDKI